MKAHLDELESGGKQETYREHASVTAENLVLQNRAFQPVNRTVHVRVRGLDAGVIHPLDFLLERQ